MMQNKEANIQMKTKVCPDLDGGNVYAFFVVCLMYYKLIISHEQTQFEDASSLYFGDDLWRGIPQAYLVYCQGQRWH